MKINCIAIDDEPLALDIIGAYCSKIPFLNLLATFDNALDTLEYLRNNPVDLIFLDIQMEGLTGIQLLKALKSKPEVIITTAYDSYAVEGFDLDVTDYLLKPISFERFIRGVNKVYERMQKEKGEALPVHPQSHPQSQPQSQSQSQSQPQSPSPFQHQPQSHFESEPEYFFVKTETRIEKVMASDILYVQGMGDYWRIVTLKKRIMTLMNARGIEEMLREPRFCRVHKSWFVALDKIDFVERRHIRIGSEHIPVSESYQKHFFELIDRNKMR